MHGTAYEQSAHLVIAGQATRNAQQTVEAFLLDDKIVFTQDVLHYSGL
jgi:hypothetical protein